MVLRHRDLFAGAARDGVPGLGVLDEEVGAARGLFSARDVGGHLCFVRREMSVRRVDGVLLAAKLVDPAF